MSFKTTVQTEIKNVKSFRKTVDMLNDFLKEKGVPDVHVEVREYTPGDQVRSHRTGQEVNPEQAGVTHIFSFGEKYYEIGVNANNGSLHFDSYSQGGLRSILGHKGIRDSEVDLLKQFYAAADVIETSAENGQHLELDTLEVDDEGNLVMELMVA